MEMGFLNRLFYENINLHQPIQVNTGETLGQSSIGIQPLLPLSRRIQWSNEVHVSISSKIQKEKTCRSRVTHPNMAPSFDVSHTVVGCNRGQCGLYQE